VCCFPSLLLRLLLLLLLLLLQIRNTLRFNWFMASLLLYSFIWLIGSWLRLKIIVMHSRFLSVFPSFVFLYKHKSFAFFFIFCCCCSILFFTSLLIRCTFCSCLIFN
jgi:hypothetical protein